MWFVIPCALALSPVLQEPEPALVEVPGGIRITADAYRHWLGTMVGGARLEEMLYERILERECAALPAESLPDDLAAVLSDPWRAAADRIEQRIATEHGGDRAAWRHSLADLAMTPDEALAIEHQHVLRETRIAALVRVERAPTDADLKRAFEAEYGPGGVATRAQHVLVSLAATRQRLEAAQRGAPPTDETVRDAARAEAEFLAGRAREAGGLEALGPVPVPDGFERFAGDPFAAALHDLEPGAVSDPIETRFGFHVVEVLGRKVTRFEDVVDEVRRAWMRAPPTLAEQRRLRERLYGKYDVRAALQRRTGR